MVEIIEETNIPLKKLDSLVQKYFHYSTTSGGAFVIEHDNDVMLTENGKMSARWVKEIAPVFIVLDTLTTYTAVEENRAELRSQALTLYKQEFMSSGATFFMTHHVPKAKGSEVTGRGSSAQTATIRFELQVSRNEELEIKGEGKVYEVVTGKNNIGMVDSLMYWRLYLKMTDVYKQDMQIPDQREIPRIVYEPDWKNEFVQKTKTQPHEKEVAEAIYLKGKCTTLELNDIFDSVGIKNKNKYGTYRKDLESSGVIVEQKGEGKTIYYTVSTKYQDILANKPQEPMEDLE